MNRTLEIGTIYRGETYYAKGAVPIEYYKVDYNIKVYIGQGIIDNTLIFSNTDHAADLRDRKLILGYVFIVYRGIVFWISKK